MFLSLQQHYKHNDFNKITTLSRSKKTNWKKNVNQMERQKTKKIATSALGLTTTIHHCNSM